MATTIRVQRADRTGARLDDIFARSLVTIHRRVHGGFGVTVELQADMSVRDAITRYLQNGIARVHLRYEQTTSFLSFDLEIKPTSIRWTENFLTLELGPRTENGEYGDRVLATLVKDIEIGAVVHDITHVVFGQQGATFRPNSLTSLTIESRS